MSENGASVEIRERLLAWSGDLTVEQAYPSVLVAIRSYRRDPTAAPLVILHANGMERHQVIAVLRQAVRQLGGAFAG